MNKIKIRGIYNIVLTLLFLSIVFYSTNAQYYHSGIDTVYFFKPGTGQNAGQDSADFPNNIFGLPDTNGNLYAPSSDPKQICSIGLGGEIIVGFKDYIIQDGPGIDFTIFENPFLNPVTNNIFAEPGKISVSEDGIKFIDFPFDSLTLKGCAGLTPTNGKAEPFNPSVSGGDGFDLATLGLNHVKYIKITDICQMILDNPKHPYYDPTISGFDLDAVVGIHLVKNNLSDVTNDELNPDIKFNETNKYLDITVQNENQYEVKIYTINGIELVRKSFEKEIILYKESLETGMYFISVCDGINSYFKKIVIYR